MKGDAKTPIGEGGLDELILRRGVLICAGTGGVGKTTISASVAARAAVLGRKAVVLTLDPAKRLATALGIEGVGDIPHDVTESLRAVCPGITGRMAAIMPDSGRTFDAFVSTLSEDPTVVQSLRRNPIFEMIAREYSGSSEYMAMVRMHALRKSGEFELIVLDTPPSRNAVAFLDAPQLLSRFFDERLVRWFVLPTNQLLATGMKKAFGILESLTGSAFVSNLFDFGSRLFEVRAEFSRHLAEIIEILRSEDCGFLLVSGAHADAAAEARLFNDRLSERSLRFDALVANRLLAPIPFSSEKIRTSEGPENPAVTRARAVFVEMREVEARSLESLEKAARRAGVPLRRVPELARDVHSVADLYAISNLLDGRDTLKS